jgi:hypothetical protein
MLAMEVRVKGLMSHIMLEHAISTSKLDNILCKHHTQCMTLFPPHRARSLSAEVNYFAFA